MQKLTLFIMLILASVSVLTFAAGDAPGNAPRSPMALAALAKLDGAVKHARADYDTAVRTAQQTALQELDAAKLAAMKAGGLDEANAIASAESKLGASTHSDGDLKAWIIATKSFKYVVGNDGPRTLSFLSDGSITGPAAGQPTFWERAWRVADDAIYINGARGEEPLLRCSDGSFRGTWHKGGGQSVTISAQ